jgi:hypothetical protein
MQPQLKVGKSTSMTKSYKMLVLLAMLQLDRMPGSIRIEEFRYLGLSNIVDREHFGMLVRELVEWRLAEYLDRSGQQEGHRCRIIHSFRRPTDHQVTFEEQS